MRALIWIKVENKDLVLIDGDWWTHPKLSLASSANVVTEWTPPDEGAIKFNVDGSVLLNRAGYGGVLRNHKDPDAEDKKVPSFGSSNAKSPRLDDEDNTQQ
ncbi:hypothetical protein V6N11_081239 [Hibiscus sabdariffa]|uniref:Uncharacterized protein n=1 Tax=Hibiscus sabdariffa TaxID=183260 RepID=A0ABR2QJ87_9ROSI